jgi:hypothetical protein
MHGTTYWIYLGHFVTSLLRYFVTSLLRYFVTSVINDKNYSNTSSNIAGFSDNASQCIFLGLAFNNSIAAGFEDK